MSNYPTPHDSNPHNSFDPIARMRQRGAMERVEDFADAEASRVVLSPFDIAIDQLHTTVPKLAPYRLTYIKMGYHKARGGGEQGQAITLKNIDGVIRSGKHRPRYPARVVAALRGQYGLPQSNDKDWGFVEMRALKNFDKWEAEERGGLDPLDFLDYLQNLLLPRSLGILDPKTDRGMHQRINEHLEAVKARFPVGSVEHTCAVDAIASNDGAIRWKDRFFRELAEEEHRKTGRGGATSEESRWARQASLELPDAVTIVDDFGKRETKGVFSEDEKEIFRSLASRAAGEATPAPVNLEAMVERMVAARLAEALKEYEVADGDEGIFSAGDEAAQPKAARERKPKGGK